MFSEWTKSAISGTPQTIKMRPEAIAPQIVTPASGYSCLHLIGGNSAAVIKTSGLGTAIVDGRVRVRVRMESTRITTSLHGLGFRVSSTTPGSGSCYGLGFDDSTSLRLKRATNLGLLGTADATGLHLISGGVVANTWYALEVSWETQGNGDLLIRGRAGVDFSSLVECINYTELAVSVLSPGGAHIGVVDAGGSGSVYYDRLELFADTL